jgi:hypothetical protein
VLIGAVASQVSLKILLLGVWAVLCVEFGRAEIFSTKAGRRIGNKLVTAALAVLFVSAWPYVKPREQPTMDQQMEIITTNLAKKFPWLAKAPAPAPPAPLLHPKSAKVTLMHLESHLKEATNNGVPTGNRPYLALGHSVGVNFHFSNLGEATADNVEGFARVYLSPDTGKVAEQRMITKFKKEKAAWMKIASGSPLPPDPNEDLWFTGLSDEVMNQDYLQKLKDGTQNIYIYMTQSYDDPTGHHYTNFCSHVQAPAFAPEVWQFCYDFKDHK